MRFPNCRLLLFLTVLPIVRPSVASSSEFEAWRTPASTRCELEQQLLVDAADGRFEEHELLRASLVACGLRDQDKITKTEQRFAAIFDICMKADNPRLTSRQRAECIFALLHKHVLNGRYEAETTDLSSALNNGVFNCVSATVLYLCLARDVGLEVQAMAQPGHVFCQMNGTERFEIQTTSPNGFGLQGFDSTESRRRTASDPSNTKRAITVVQLVGKIYYNRGVAMLHRERYADALRMLRISSRLDPNDAMARGNLLACINNWALLRCEQKQFSAAAELLSHGMAIAPNYSPFLDNESYVHHRWVTQLCAASEYSRALTLLGESKRRRPNALFYDSGRLSVYKMWIRELEDHGRHSEAIAVMAKARRSFPKSFPASPNS